MDMIFDWSSILEVSVGRIWRVHGKFKVSKSNGKSDVVVNVRGETEKGRGKIFIKDEKSFCLGKKSPIQNWTDKKRSLIVLSFARSIILLCVVSRCGFFYVRWCFRSCDWLTDLQFVCSCLCLCRWLSVWFSVTCVCARSCDVLGFAQDYSVWYESKYDVPSRRQN